MGYYTNYRIIVSPDIQNPEKTIDMKGISETLEDIAQYEFDWWGSEISLYDSKWYENESNMTELSKLYPDILFQVDGEGEEKEDMWSAWYKNGKYYCESVRIEWPTYDPAKLSEGG